MVAPVVPIIVPIIGTAGANNPYNYAFFYIDLVTCLETSVLIVGTAGADNNYSYNSNADNWRFLLNAHTNPVSAKSNFDFLRFCTE